MLFFDQIRLGILASSYTLAFTIFWLSAPTSVAQELEFARSIAAIRETIPKLRPLQKELNKPTAGQWLSSHDEKGQSFKQYLRIRPTTLTTKRNKLYVQPIGAFDATQQKILNLCARYLGTYFQCEAIILPTKDESVIPTNGQRINSDTNQRQLLTSAILEQVLAPELPDNAFASIAFTSSDLWPGDGWNFVFGQAMFRDRVGVWSLHRLGDPHEGDDAFAGCLRRTIKVATHETGHMFSMQHCTAYSCNMQGSNSLAESDAQPLWLCPECHAKLLYSTQCQAQKRFVELLVFCEDNGLPLEAAYYREAISLLK